MFQGDLFEALGINVPKELKTEPKVSNKEKTKEKAQAKKAVSNAISKKPATETYAKLPVTVVYGFDKIELGVDDFDESVIVYKVEKPQNSKAQPKEEEKEKQQSLLETAEADVKESEDAADENDEVDEEEKEVTADKKEEKAEDKKNNSGDEYLYDETIPKVTLEAIRVRLEEDYPAFSKERTSMQYDKDKNIVVPVITKGSLGGC